MNKDFKRKASMFLSIVSFICIFLLIVDGIWPNLCMFFLNGNTCVFLGPKKILLFCIFFIILLHPYRLKNIPKNLLIYLFILISYLCFTVFYEIYYLKLSFISLIYGLKYYYSTFLLFPFLIVVDKVITEKKIIEVFKYIFIICGLLALFQIFSNTPILPIISKDANYMVF